jgi:hypothetical protein
LNQFFKNGKKDWRNVPGLAETTFREKNLVNWSESSQLLSTSRCYTSTGHPIYLYVPHASMSFFRKSAVVRFDFSRKSILFMREYLCHHIAKDSI